HPRQKSGRIGRCWTLIVCVGHGCCRSITRWGVAGGGVAFAQQPINYIVGVADLDSTRVRLGPEITVRIVAWGAIAPIGRHWRISSRAIADPAGLRIVGLSTHPPGGVN